MKRIISIVLTLCIISGLFTALPFTAYAQTSGTCGDDLTWTLDDEGTLTISGTGDMYDYKYYWDIPWETSKENIKKIIIKNGVTNIGSHAFDNCESLINIIIPDSVTRIGRNALGSCHSLTSITMPDSVTTIESFAFTHCYALTDIKISDNVTTIEPYTFQGCDSLTSIIIPNNVTSIGDYAFSYCYALTNIKISDSVTSIGDYAFFDCVALTNITIPDGIKHINDAVFSGCKSLKNITIPENVTSIGNNAFEECSSLISITIPDSVTSIGSHAFCGCIGLTNVIIPNGVTIIENDVFFCCQGLTNIIIPYGVTSIGIGAFSGCSSLTSITIPDSVTSIGDATFNDCTNLTDVYYTGSADEWENISIGSYNEYLTTATIHCTDLSLRMGVCGDDLIWVLDDNGTLTISGTGDMWDFEPDANWESSSAPWYSSIQKIKNVVIEDGVTSVGNYAFWWCESLKSISISESVTSIGDYAFNLCYNLTRLTIPDSVTYIGEAAFYNCSSLKSINIGNRVEVIGESAFVNSYQLTSITIPDSVKTIGNSAFLCCECLTKATIGKSVTNIGLAAFEGCYELTDVFYRGNESEWSDVEIGDQNECLTDATMHFSGSNLANGTSGIVAKVYATAFSPSNNSVLTSNTTDLKITFNTTVKPTQNRKIRIKDYKTDKEVMSFDMSEVSVSGVEVTLSDVSLDKGKSYYITIDGGAIVNQNGVPFYGIDDKSVWHFSTDNVSTKHHVSLKYPQKGSLWWKSDDTDFPPIPSEDDSEYTKELTAWAEAYNVDSIADASDKNKLLNMAVKMPVTDVNGQTFLLNDKGTTVKQVMQDLIFIENLKPYIEKIDKKLEATTEDFSKLTDYKDEADLYNMAESYTVQLQKYINSRYGKEKSSFFLSVAVPLAYQALIKTVTNDLGSQESSLVKTIADATVQTNALKSDISTVSGASDYATYKQGLSDIKNYTKLGKELYKITTNGVSKSTVKCGIDMLNMYFKDTGVTGSNEALNMISQAWSQIQSSKSAIQMSMFLGNSLGFFPYVLDLYTKGNKKLADETKAWYFIADYYLDEKYPGLLDLVYDENGYALKSDYNPYDANTRVTENYHDEIQSDIILRKWAKLVDVTGLIDNNTKNIVNTRRDMVNAVNVFRFAKAVDVEEVKKSLLNYISAELNRGKTTEVYGMCPIMINVYDKDNRLVASYSSENENDINTEYGSFYLLGDDNDTKYFILSSDEYRMEIVPYADGEMSVAITQKDENGKITETAYYENVPIQEGECYSTDDLSGGVLVKDGEEELEQNEAGAESIEIISSVDEWHSWGVVVLSCEIYPDYTADKTVEWSVDRDDTQIRGPYEDGSYELYIGEEGAYTVTAESNGLTATKEITVYTYVEEMSVRESEITMIAGEEYTPEVILTPEADRTVKWTSSDANVAYVNEDGIIVAKAAGEAIITAELDGLRAEMYVTVSEAVLDIVAYQSDTDGDRIKLDITNMSCTEDFSGEAYIGIYHDGSLTRFIKYPISLLKQESITDYINVELDGSDYDVKLFLWSQSMFPLQKPKEMKLLSNIKE